VALNLERDRVSIPSRYYTDVPQKLTCESMKKRKKKKPKTALRATEFIITFTTQFSLKTTWQIIQREKTTWQVIQNEKTT